VRTHLIKILDWI